MSATRTLLDDALNVPNALTLARILVIPVVLWLLDLGTPAAGVTAALVYTGAMITDLLDGFLARRLGVVSVLGKFLDPLADKLLVMACLVWMVPMGRIDAWVVVLLLSREIAVTGLRSIASSEGVVIAAGRDGKSKTALQMLGILNLMLGFPFHLHFGPFDMGVVDLVPVGRVLIYLSLFFSFTSAAEYVVGFAKALAERKRAGVERPVRQDPGDW